MSGMGPELDKRCDELILRALNACPNGAQGYYEEGEGDKAVMSLRTYAATLRADAEKLLQAAEDAERAAMLIDLRTDNGGHLHDTH